jgi:hypothetical protein
MRAGARDVVRQTLPFQPSIDARSRGRPGPPDGETVPLVLRRYPVNEYDS